MLLMSHIREHESLKMIEIVSAQMQQTLGVPLPPIDIYHEGQDLPPEIEMAITIAASQNLPPVPPPMPMSVGAQQQTEQAGDEEGAIDAQTLAKIERETAGFVAKQKQQEQAHQQKLRHAEELHRAKLAHMDDQTVADILRENARATAQLRDTQLTNRARMRGDIEREKAKVAAMRKNAKANRAPLTRGRAWNRKKAGTG